MRTVCESSTIKSLLAPIGLRGSEHQSVALAGELESVRARRQSEVWTDDGVEPDRDDTTISGEQMTERLTGDRSDPLTAQDDGGRAVDHGTECEQPVLHPAEQLVRELRAPVAHRHVATIASEL